MVSGEGPGGAADDRLWATEWWERLADRWTGAGPRRVAAIAAALSVLVLLVALLSEPALRAGIGAWIGSLWVAVLAFVLVRTKTLSWSAYAWTLAGAMVWAVLVASVLAAVAAVVTPGVQSTGATVVVAAVGEDALKLLPLLVLVVVAPGRVQRFAIADVLLLGVAAGAGFMAVEEFVRRVVQVGRLGVVPENVTSYSLLGAHLGETGGEPIYPGHHVATGVVLTAVAVAVYVLRRARRTPLVWAAVVVVPTLLWWIMVARHAVMNAGALDVEAPAPFRLTEAVTPDLLAAPVMLAIAAVVAMLIDARRLSRWGDASFESRPPPAWHDQALQWVDGLAAQGEPQRRVGVVAASGVQLGHLVSRDLRQVGEVITDSAGEKRSRTWPAMRTLISMQRQMREIAYHLDAGESPTRPLRLGAAGLAGVLVVTALVLAPLGSLPVRGSGDTLADWLAGQFASWWSWWPSLSGWEQMIALLTAASTVGATVGSTLLARPAPAPTVPLSDGSESTGLWAEIDAFLADPDAWASAQRDRLLGRS